LQFKAESFNLTLADDGQGFAAQDKLNRFNGSGLKNIESRAILIGAIAAITSSPGNGCTSAYNLTTLHHKQMLSDPIQIVLVDDHRLFRSGIAALINSLPGYHIIYEASNGLELSKKITPKTQPDIILLDINMPHMNGIETAQWLKTHYPDVKIIVLSMFEDADKVLTMLRLGVKGYLLKDAEPHEFEEALKKVANNEVYFPAFVTRHLVYNFNQPETVKLNSREIEFLKMASTELTYKEIADRMCISARTVDGYRDQLFDKLQIKSRVGLVLYAIKHKLIEV